MNAQTKHTAGPDVVSAMVSKLYVGGNFGPREMVLHWNENPRPTGLIANWVSAKTPETLRALRKAERDGLVECSGTQKPARSWNAADRKELHWKLTSAAIAKATGEQP